jgi:hypothetical protein
MSGRISTTTAFCRGLLGINPLYLDRDGKVVSIGKSRGLKAGLGHDKRHMRADPPDLDYLVGFGHINAPAFLKETVAYFSGLFGITDYFETDIGIIAARTSAPFGGHRLYRQGKIRGNIINSASWGCRTSASPPCSTPLRTRRRQRQLSVLHNRPERRRCSGSRRTARFLRDMYAPKKYTPAVIEFVDIAGLVRARRRARGSAINF